MKLEATPRLQLSLFRGPDRWVSRQVVASSSQPGRRYTLARDAAGAWGCSCPAWVYDPLRRPCKHIRLAMASAAAVVAHPPGEDAP